MNIPRFKAYDPNTQLECDVISFDYRLNELGLKPVDSEYVYYSTRNNVIIWELKDKDEKESIIGRHCNE